MKLVKLETMTIEEAAHVFASDDLDDFLKAIEADALSFVADVSTAQGRDACKSKAYQISKHKSKLDSLGKELVTEWKTKSKKVDESRKKARDFLDNLKDIVRKPVTDWENAERERIADIECRIEELDMLIYPHHSNGFWKIELTSDDLRTNLETAKEFKIDESLEEFTQQASIVKDKVINKLETMLKKQITVEKERAELELLRKEKEERDRIEYEDKIKREAAEQAAREEREKAEQRIRAEKDAREKAERERQEEIERAEREKKEAAERAEREKLEAIRTEQRRQAEQEQARRDAEERARKEKERKAADLIHRKKINNEVLEDLLKTGLREENALPLMKAIVNGDVRNVTINY